MNCIHYATWFGDHILNSKLLEFGDTEELNKETLFYRTKVGIATFIIKGPDSPISRAFI